MVGWRAETNFRSIQKGTILTLYFAPHVRGHAPPPLEPGAKINVSIGDRWTELTTITVSDELITVEAQDGALWMMTPRNANDSPFPGTDTGEIPSEDWVIRSSASR